MSEPSHLPPRIRLGVFDSGVGGLSVLRELRLHLPGAQWHYVADSAHAPYSDLTPDAVRARSLGIADHLIHAGAQLLVVACNTATAIAIESLRDRWPALPIVGVEPGLKPALALTRNGRVGVMATPATLASDRFRRLMDRHAPGVQVHLQGCDGLAAAIETGDLAAPALLELIERHCAPMRYAGVDTVVLGCTHYPFVRAHIQTCMGDEVMLVDTASAVARRARHLCERLASPAAGDDLARPWLQTSGDVAHLTEIAGRWLDFAVDVGPLG